MQSWISSSYLDSEDAKLNKWHCWSLQWHHECVKYCNRCATEDWGAPCKMVCNSTPAFQEVTRLCQKPRTCQIQHNRVNYPAVTIDEYFKRNLTVPFVDHLLSQLCSRFDVGDQEIVMQGLHLCCSLCPTEIKGYMEGVFPSVFHLPWSITALTTKSWCRDD